MIGNYCFLPASSNKLISDSKPSYYFKNIIPKEKYSEILDSNLIPNDITIFEKDDYIKFLEKRSELLMFKINEYIGNK